MSFNTFPIQRKWIGDLVLLSDSALGNGYLTFNYFENVIKSFNYSGFCVFYNDRVIAFLICYRTTRKEVLERLNDSDLYSKLDEHIFCLDTMVVTDKFRSQGIGKMLIDLVITDYKKEAGFIMYAWKQKGIINMQKIADNFLFSKLKEYQEFWKKDCENNLFRCPVNTINSQTCQCSCVLFYRKQEK